MLSVIEAQQRILSYFSSSKQTHIHLDQSLGRILAEDLFASIDLPPFENSGMDGYAVISRDTREASPGHILNLKVVEDIPAGFVSDIVIQTGQAARIMTGAVLPSGADAVIKIEDTDTSSRNPGEPIPQQIVIHQPVKVGKNIRHKGEDIQKGNKFLNKGSTLRPQELGLLAMMGMASIPVHEYPRLALLSSGDELISVDAPQENGKIRDANNVTLAALAHQAGAKVIHLGVAPDDPLVIKALLEKAVDLNVDLIVSSAGVSVGAFDYVKQVVEEHGSLDFWRVNVRPGKPLAFGKFQDIPFFGLPGNPVSAFISFVLFIRPALRKMNGIDPIFLPRESVHLAEEISSDGRESYLRAVVTFENGQRVARLTGHQGSGNLLSLVQANALLIVPSGVKSLPAGTVVEAMFL